MDLYRDVIQLLSENDCVIIPNFGGFVTNYVGARVDVSSQEFFPPYRLVAFNENLKSNDGLLINFLSSDRNISWKAADDYVHKFVETINKRLSLGESVKFDKLGKFTRQDACLVFEPENVDIASDSYGLTSFHFPLLKKESSLIVQKPILVSKTKSAKTNKAKKSYSKFFYAASVAAIFLGLSFLSIRYEIFSLSTNTNLEQAKIVPLQSPCSINVNNDPIILAEDCSFLEKENELADNIVLEPTAGEDYSVEELTPKQEISENILEVEKNIEEVANDYVGPIVPGKSYIIAGCFADLENAVNYRLSFVKMGYPSELIRMKTGLVGVAVKSYSNFQDAALELQELKSKVDNSSLWIHN